MPNTMKIRIPVIVTSDKKWGALGAHSDAEPDWAGIEDMCFESNWSTPLDNPQRCFAEVEVELPETKAVVGVIVPADAA